MVNRYGSLLDEVELNSISKRVEMLLHHKEFLALTKVKTYAEKGCFTTAN